MKIIGLDISTRFIGYTIIENEKIIEISHFDLSKIENIWWDKVDKLKEMVHQLKLTHPNIDKVYIEESLQTFKSGFSSAQVLSTLSKFNIITAYLFREIFGISPNYISAAHARKVCGIKIEKKASLSSKDQVVEHMLKHDLKEFSFPVKKSGQIKDFVKDQIDSYVIARAGFLE
jgi:hypothetical protein